MVSNIFLFSLAIIHFVVNLLNLSRQSYLNRHQEWPFLALLATFGVLNLFSLYSVTRMVSKDMILNMNIGRVQIGVTLLIIAVSGTWFGSFLIGSFNNRCV